MPPLLSLLRPQATSGSSRFPLRFSSRFVVSFLQPADRSDVSTPFYFKDRQLPHSLFSLSDREPYKEVPRLFSGVLLGPLPFPDSLFFPICASLSRASVSLPPHLLTGHSRTLPQPPAQSIEITFTSFSSSRAWPIFPPWRFARACASLNFSDPPTPSPPFVLFFFLESFPPLDCLMPRVLAYKALVDSASFVADIRSPPFRPFSPLLSQRRRPVPPFFRIFLVLLFSPPPCSVSPRR